MTDDAAPTEAAIPAATVVLLRDGSDGPEVLLVRRDRALRFAGGHWVFPGGRVDDADRAGGAAAIDVARGSAAVREAHEEVGVHVAATSLIELSHWTPPPESTRRFLTWFFVAAAPDAPIVIDDGEIRDHRWVRTDEALGLHHEEAFPLSPPTWITLHDLAAHRSVDEALTAASARATPRFATRIVDGGAGSLVALYAGDVAYEGDGTDVDAPGPRHRLVMSTPPWHYEVRQ